MAESRLCVGTRDGPRSTVWKVVTRRGDAYIISRLMGAATKVSLHESGQGQWSFTTSWAEAMSIPPRKRHIDRWQVRQPAPDRAALIFRLLFPYDELRAVGPPAKDASITFVAPPTPGLCAALEFYLAPYPPESVPLGDAPFPVVEVLPLSPPGCVVILRNQEPIDAPKATLIAAARARLAELNLTPPPHVNLPVRGALLVEFEDHTRGFIEIAPFHAAA